VTRRAAAEQGSGTVLVLVAVALLITTALVLSVLGGLLVRQRRLESAADLAALAGASAVQHGRDGCAWAHQVALRNEATLLRCRRSGDVVEVVAGASVSLPLGLRASLRAPARAGPAGDGSPP
jgi:secretion/DNA translocation related TadE-like protein